MYFIALALLCLTYTCIIHEHNLDVDWSESRRLLYVCLWETPKFHWLTLRLEPTWAWSRSLMNHENIIKQNLIFWDLVRHTREVSFFSCIFGYGSKRLKWWMGEVSGVSTNLIPTRLTECHHVEIFDRALAKQVEFSSWELPYPYQSRFIINCELLELSSFISCTNVIVTWTMFLHVLFFFLASLSVSSLH